MSTASDTMAGGMSAIAATLEHSILRPEADVAQMERVVGEAMRYQLAAVCVSGCHVERAAALLAGSPVKLCTVVGYPLGTARPEAMAHEAVELVKLGAQAVEFVAPLRYLLSQATDDAALAMRIIVEAVRAARKGVALKAIIEAPALVRDTDVETAESRIGSACDAARRAGCDCVISATGQHPAGVSTVEMVRLMRKHALGLSVKAGGGVRTWAEAKQMLDAGADRIGSSNAVVILKGRQAAAGVS